MTRYKYTLNDGLSVRTDGHPWRPIQRGRLSHYQIALLILHHHFHPAHVTDATVEAFARDKVSKRLPLFVTHDEITQWLASRRAGKETT